MMKKLLVSLLSALLCISVVAEPETQLKENQNETDVKIDEKGDVFVAPLKYHISDDGTTKVIEYKSYIDLESVVIPSEIRIAGYVYPVTSIEYRAFYGCYDMTNIEIPSSVTHIDIYAFDYCSELTSINVSRDNPNYSSEDGILYDKNKTTLVLVPEGKEGSIVLLSGVTCIGDNACSGCRNLTSIEIPSSVTRIGDYAFSECYSLTNIEIPSGVTSIRSGAFSDCIKMKSMKIPSSVRSIENKAFSGCSGLTSIEIPSSVTSIGDYAFKDCSGLTEIYIPSSVTYIEDWAFQNCKNLDVIIDNSEENVAVGRSAFLGCKSVKFLK